MSAVILRDEIIHYEVLGRGRPVIFLHSWVGSWRYWIPSMQSASLSFRTYALDLWGFGDSAKNPSYYSIEQQINLLEEFLTYLGIGKIALVGHGLGAIISLLFTARNPQQVDRVMAIGLPGSENAVHPRMRSAPPAELAEWLLGRTPASESAGTEVPKIDPKAIQLSLANLDTLKLTGLTQRTNTPCLLVYGLNDPAIETSRQEPGSTQPLHTHAITFEQSGHYPMLDEPAKFNRLLGEFLNQATGETLQQLQLKDEWKRRVR